MQKKIYCRRCKEEIDVINAHGYPEYRATARSFVRVEAFHYDCDVDYPLEEYLPYGKVYEHYHYYHRKCFECFGLEVPNPIPEIVNAIV